MLAVSIAASRLSKNPPRTARFTVVRVFRILAVGLAWALTGCASPRMLGDPALLQFLQVSSTTRDQVVARLGAPLAAFEPDRVMIYGLDRDRAGYVLGWRETSLPGGRLHLVIEFDERAVLRRYAVVNVETGLPR